MRATIEQFAARHFHVGRGGRAKLAISTSLMTRVIGACVSLVNVPLAVRYLGNEGYGILVVIVSVVGWIQFSNLGLGLGLQNALTEQVALGNKESQQELVSTTFFALMGIALLLALLAATFFPLVDWLKVFPAPSRQFALTVPKVVALTIGCFIATTMWGFIQPIYAARQELHIFNLQGSAASLAGLIALFLAVRFHSGLLGVAISNIGVTAAFSVGFGLWTLYGRGLEELRPRWASVRLTAWRSVYRTGLGFLLLQICAVAMFQSDAFIISRFLPIAAVTPYSVAQRAFAQLIGVLGIVTASLWPAFGNARALGDLAWMRRIYKKLISYSLLIYGSAFICIAVFGQKLFSLWVGKQAAPPTLLVCAIGLNYLLILWTNNHALLLNALGIIKKQVVILSIHALTTLALNIYLVQKLGTIGMALGGILTYLSISAWYLPWLFHHTLKSLPEAREQRAPVLGDA